MRSGANITSGSRGKLERGRRRNSGVQEMRNSKSLAMHWEWKTEDAKPGVAGVAGVQELQNPSLLAVR
jgi:hypothetical protein